MQVNKLEAPLLNFWVAKSLGLEPIPDGRGAGSVSVINTLTGKLEPFQPSLDWSQAGPLLAAHWHELESVLLEWYGPQWPYLEIFQAKPQVWFMRALVAVHFGDEVEEL